MLDNDVRIVSDDYNNSLLVYATLTNIKIERILTNLDVVATQG